MLAAALVLRLAVWLFAAGHPERRCSEDSLSYLSLAHTLAAHGEFAHQHGGVAEFFRVPGYPVFLAPFVAVFGEPANWVALVQVLVDTAVVLLVMLLCASRLPRAQVLLAGGLYAASLVAVDAANMVWSETIFTALLTVVLLLADRMARGEERSRLWLSGASGLLLGVSVLVRVVALPLILPLMVVAAWRGPVRKRLACALLCLCAFGAPVGGWMARNRTRGNDWRVSTAGETKLLLYDAAMVQVSRTRRPYYEVRAELAREASAQAVAAGDDSPAGLARVQRQMAIGILGHQPGHAAACLLKQDALNLLPDSMNFLQLVGLLGKSKSGTLGVFQEDGPRSALSHWLARKGLTGRRLGLALLLTTPFALALAVTYFLSARGAASLLRNREFLFLALLLVPVVYLLLVPGGASLPRFGAPAMPFICILAAWGWRRSSAGPNGRLLDSGRLPDKMPVMH